MAKYYGFIGYAETNKTKPGVWEEELIVRKAYSGDVYRKSRSWQNGQNVNDELNVNLEVSIVADPYAFHNFHKMRIIQYMGTYWKISNIDVQYPRLVLTLGDVYTGPIGEEA